MLMCILSATSNALWHPMQYVGLFMVVFAVVCLCKPKKDGDD